MSIVFKNNTPYLEEQNLVELTNLVTTPFYIYSQKNISETFIKLKEILNKDIYFAVKANSNQAIISLLGSLGAGADVVSSEELQRALIAGIEPKKIIFEGVGKSDKDLNIAIQKEIKQINIESIDELVQINNIANSLNKKPGIAIRVNPDIEINSIDKISTGKKNDKFGIDFNDLPEICNKLKSLKNVSFSGLSCHIGSQLTQINFFRKIFIKMKKAIEVFESNNFIVKNLDLGGGFGISYNKKEDDLDLIELAKLIKEIYPNNKYQISFEPGRYLVARSGYLITKILNVKKNGEINYLITDAGMQTLLRPALYNSIHKILPFENYSQTKKYTVAGPICESSDILAKDINLPVQQKNSFLIICDVGAYGSVMASNYNSKCLPSEVLINKNKYAIIRQAQNINDIIKKDNLPNWFKN
tara:strand:- start:6740 stop:7987 length:1248 start_codon:yes stop_codon:yes gene_type:complete